jgi:ABC-type phosphate transport system substrate-binding protein
MHNIYRRTGLAAVGALAISVALTGPAHSDPKFVPDSNDIVGVGSDTTQFALDDVASAFNKAKVGGSTRLASFDATGSSAGIDELQANPDVSFARSSRGPAATGDEGTSFSPFASDNLSYIYAKPKSRVSLTLDAQDLFDIYTCAKTDWSQFGMPGGHIEAKVPQAGSGTRSFFLASIGETEQQLEDAINEPDSVCSVDEVEENDPSPFIGVQNAIGPFSHARYLTLPRKDRKKVGYAADAGAPFDPARDLYNVIRTADTGTLGQFFDQNSWLCTSAQAGKVITKQNGFQPLPAGQCGVPIIA